MALPDTIFDLHGWCPKNKATRLYELVKEIKPDRVVEFGVFGGRSFIPMAIALKETGQGEIIGVDPWSRGASTENYVHDDPNFAWWNSLDHEAIYSSFITALRRYGVYDISKVERKTSREMVFDDESIDILHQDGNHSEGTSTEEVNLFARKIKPGGLWIMDDTDWETTKNAQEAIIENGFRLYEDYIAWKIFKKNP